MKFCPRCGAKVSGNEANCPRCGKDLISVRKVIYGEQEIQQKRDLKPEVKGKKPATGNEQQVICPFCGSAVSPEGSRCKYCGTLIRPAEEYSCPYCGNRLTFIAEYQRWYCYHCRVYP